MINILTTVTAMKHYYKTPNYFFKNVLIKWHTELGSMVPVDNFVFAVSGLNSVAIVYKCKFYFFFKKQIKINHHHMFWRLNFRKYNPLSDVRMGKKGV